MRALLTMLCMAPNCTCTKPSQRMAGAVTKPYMYTSTAARAGLAALRAPSKTDRRILTAGRNSNQNSQGEKGCGSDSPDPASLERRGSTPNVAWIDHQRANLGTTSAEKQRAGHTRRNLQEQSAWDDC